VFYRLKLIEAYGTGIQKVLECYADYDAEPVVEVSDNAFKITLPSVNASAPTSRKAKAEGLSARERRVLQLFENAQFIVRKDVEHAIGVSQATAIVLLREMVERGVLQKSGSGRKLKYIRPNGAP